MARTGRHGDVTETLRRRYRDVTETLPRRYRDVTEDGDVNETWGVRMHCFAIRALIAAAKASSPPRPLTVELVVCEVPPVKPSGESLRNLARESRVARRVVELAG